MVFIVPFDFCNYSSISAYLKHRKINFSLLTNDQSSISAMDTIIIPGVGSFSEGMAFLSKNNFVSLVRGFADSGGRILGICLGMQLLFNRSEESPNVEGLGIVPGVCKRLPIEDKFPVPRIGWSEILIHPQAMTYRGGCHSVESPEFFKSDSDFYFVHSYVCAPSQTHVISATFYHGRERYCASIESGNVIGLQYHPEKSGNAGYKVLDSIIPSNEEKNHTDASH